MATLKFVISSRKNLQKKYGSSFSGIESGLATFLASDKKKGFDTRLIYLDDAATAKTYGFKVLSAIGEKSCKTAFDSLYTRWQPAYMVIFGSQDIIPFQTLTNHAPGDDDKTAPSDLPYACSAPYGKNMSAFTGPVRVVGRIPDIPGTADPAYFYSLFDDISKHQPVDAVQYSKYFAVTAEVWTDSTQLSIKNTFGNNTALLKSPPTSGNFSSAALKPMAHFFNCHGALHTADYYGQHGNNYPVAISATDLDGKVSYGTVAAAECCYGAQLFKPSKLTRNSLSIANAYLKNHAVSFLGSSTVAFGPSSGNGLADLICQYFMINVLAGASTGRALLEARQKFVQESGPHLDPCELKTLAQFYILGDPSLQPVLTLPSKSASNTVENRRFNLFNKGTSLGQSTARLKKLKTPGPSSHKKYLDSILKESGFTGSRIEHVFEANIRTSRSGATSKSLSGGKVRFRAYARVGEKHPVVKNIHILVVKENDNQILGWRTYVSR